MDIAHAEAVEGGLDLLIEKRDKQRRRDEGERTAHELWQQSVDRYHDRARRENAARWYTFHADMHELHSRLAAEHEAKAQKLLEGDDAA